MSKLSSDYFSRAISGIRSAASRASVGADKRADGIQMIPPAENKRAPAKEKGARAGQTAAPAERSGTVPVPKVATAKQSGIPVGEGSTPSNQEGNQAEQTRNPAKQVRTPVEQKRIQQKSITAGHKVTPADTWLPLEAALVWIDTRDPQLTQRKIQQVEQALKKPATGIRLRPDFSPIRDSRSVFKGENEANGAIWKKLRVLVARGSVVVRGSKTDLNAEQNIPPWERPLEGEQITGASSLVLIWEDPGFALYLDTYPLEPFAPWRGIIVSMKDLFRAFPPSHRPSLNKTLPQGKARKIESVIFALQSLADSDGNLPTWSEDARFHAVNKWLVDHGYEKVSNTCVKNGSMEFLRRRK